MSHKIILNGSVLWCFEDELTQANLADEFRVMLSFASPLHYHRGSIELWDTAVAINGDINLHIPLGSLQELYMGFDEHYKRLFVKNGGLFWQPLRLSYEQKGWHQTIYVIVDYNGFTSKNKLWFDTLKAMFK